MNDIKGFFREYRWLSNFWLVAIRFIYQGQELVFPSVEHAFQACKSMDVDIRKMFCDPSMSAKEAKRLGRSVVIRDDWFEMRIRVMEFFVRAKFNQHPDLCAKLLATGDAYLEETNTWRDMFWGVCYGTGENQLGKILMRVRYELGQEEGGD